MRSGASSRRSGIASKARGYTNHWVHKSPDLALTHSLFLGFPAIISDHDDDDDDDDELDLDHMDCAGDASVDCLRHGT